jgi:DNA (cytosine-5)-methyltransferase 1
VNVLDLFSGIGGFSLGLERAGMRTVAFCEIDPFCRQVLAKHWPNVPCYSDVRYVTASRLMLDDVWPINVICGGFPCQDISVAGKGAGLRGERSGLWSEYRRIVDELRPRYVIVENVAALLGRGLATVLGELAEIGYDAEWHCIPASTIGAHHQRDRIWIIAYAISCELRDEPGRRSGAHRAGKAVSRNDGAAESLAHAAGDRRPPEGEWPAPRYIVGSSQLRLHSPTNWDTEPDVGRVADGVPNRLDRLRSLGNSVVPQITEAIGRAIQTRLALTEG